MRVPLTLATLAFAAALPSAAAQSDGCTQSNPCPWAIAVDDAGFVGESEWNWTMGDWFELSVSNDDSVAHTVTLSGYSLQFQVPADGERSQVVQLTKAGHFDLADQPSGDTIPVTVVNGDVVDYEKGLIDANGNAAGTKARTPGLETPMLGLALLGATFVALRRRA
jgi:hypothetical protein